MPVPRVLAFRPDGSKRLGHRFSQDDLTGDFSGVRLDGGEHSMDGETVAVSSSIAEPKAVDCGVEAAFQVQAAPKWNAGDATDEITEQDRVVIFTPGPPPFTDWILEIEPEEGYQSFAPVTYESLTPGVAAASPNGEVTAHKAGEAVVRVEQGGTVVDHAFSTVPPPGSEVRVFVRHVTGSAARHIHDQVIDRLIGLTPSEDARRLFSVADHAAGVYERNPECWLAGVDTTCLSVYNRDGGGGGTIWRVTAISPRHAVGADHFNYTPRVGNRLRWVTMDGEVIERTVVARRHPPEFYDEAGNYVVSFWPRRPDIGIVVLDEDLPPTITPAPLLPLDIPDRLPNLAVQNQSSYLPGVVINRGLEAIPKGRMQFSQTLGHPWIFGELRTWSNQVGASTWEHYPLFNWEEFGGWGRGLIQGDSGNFSGIIFGGKLVLGGVHTGPSSASNLLTYRDLINSLMSEDGEYELTHADLSAFPTYT
ncbi:MAG: hypothetical protein JJU00_13070 [Opitutales bacterium]|nr:hypothetical protein [Opitutales bacterium]